MTGSPEVRWRHLPLPVRWLVINQFGVNLGFYLLVPFLAAYLIDDLHVALVVVGLILGLRNLAQQGMFLLGGSLTDRIGPRPVIIAGCLLRVIGFGLFGFGQTVPLLIIAAVLTGLAGALFNPAVRAFVAASAAGQRAAAFSYFAIGGNAGALVGPVLGSVLLQADFRLVALVAAGVFALLTVLQLIWLPAAAPPADRRPLLAGWWSILINKRFVIFTLAGSSLFALQNQLYLLLPRRADQLLGGQVGTVVIFVVSTVVALGSQRPVTRAAQSRWGGHRSIMVGIGLIGAGFAVPGVLAALPLPVPDPVDFGAVLVATVALAVGVVIAQPFLLERIADHAPAELTGSYYGAFYLVSGVIAAASSALVGAALDVSPWLPWLICAALGLGCAAVAALRVTAPASNPVPA
ncbi:MFS transporter [Microlunatus sp. GCM10028923]|uniref:MFS transporter n=1 Tax=Microlunatus sp. GCM10028923 TaxID=3273400 RepID=UPI0036112F24